jgi:hypothetical protein
VLRVVCEEEALVARINDPAVERNASRAFGYFSDTTLTESERLDKFMDSFYW